jgi:polysaccharide chain length determinant protein (PEP-CTERM system associated)
VPHESAELQLLKRFARHAWRLAWALLAVQVAATAAGIAVLKVVPKRYSSTTTIRVEKSQLINPLTRGLAVTSEMEDRVRTLREEILSRDYFERIIARLGLKKPGSSVYEDERFVQQMIRDTVIATRQNEAGTFEITYTGSDPRVVRDVTNALAGIFIEDSLSNKANEANAAVDFLERQLVVYREKLEASEIALRQFEERHVDQVPATRAAQVARVEQLRATLGEVQNNLRQAKLQRGLIRQRVLGGAAAASGETITMANPLQRKIWEKEAELRRLLVDFSENHPDVVTLRGEIEHLKAELAANPAAPPEGEAAASGANEMQIQDAMAYGQLQQLEVEIRSLSTREEQLLADLARAEKKVQGIPEVEQDLARLRRDYDVNNEIYNSFLRRLEEARVSRELELKQKGEVFKVLQKAPLPLAPSKPTRAQALLGGAAAGLAINLALLFLAALRDTSYQSAAEIKAELGLKILAGIPRCPRAGQALADRVKAFALGLAALAYLSAVAVFLTSVRIMALMEGGR